MIERKQKSKYEMPAKKPTCSPYIVSNFILIQLTDSQTFHSLGKANLFCNSKVLSDEGWTV